MAKEQAEKKAVKRPQAQKRDDQANKRRVQNKAFKSMIRTSIRKFDDFLTKGDNTSAQSSLKEIYSLMDKGVKKGVLKLNTASRTKSRLTARVAAKS